MIILILNPNKAAIDQGSYRPISLINQGANIFTAVLAREIIKRIDKYVKNDQCGSTNVRFGQKNYENKLLYREK